MSFNLSNPTPLKSNEKKIAWYEKFWAGISLISLFGEGMMPKGVKDNMPVAARNVIVMFFMLLIAYLACSGIYFNAMLLIDATSGISFSLGDSFYYYGFIAIVFIALGYFNLEKEVVEHATRKKFLKDAVKEIGKNAIPSIKPLAGAFNSSRSGTIASSIFSFLNVVWTIWGIIFYDRWLFVGLIALSILFGAAMIPVKNVKHVRLVLILEIVATIILLSFILLNHFLIF